MSDLWDSLGASEVTRKTAKIGGFQIKPHDPWESIGKTAGEGAFGWPLLPGNDGENHLACPVCGSGNVRFVGGNLGSDVVRGTMWEGIECKDCGTKSGAPQHFKRTSPSDPNPPIVTDYSRQWGWKKLESSHKTAGAVILLRNTGPGTAELVFPDGYTSDIHLIDGIADNTGYPLDVISEMVDDVRRAAETGIYTIEVPISATGSKTADVSLPKCPVCGKDGDLGTLGGRPCMPCVRARQRAAQDGKCHCGNQRIPGPEKAPFGARGRKWIPCERCLGTIRQTGSIKTAMPVAAASCYKCGVRIELENRIWWDPAHGIQCPKGGSHTPDPDEGTPHPSTLYVTVTSAEKTAMPVAAASCYKCGVRIELENRIWWDPAHGIQCPKGGSHTPDPDEGTPHPSTLYVTVTSAEKTAMPSPAELGVKVGDIFYNSWGYDQTNIDYYEVVRLTGQGVEVQPINARVVEVRGQQNMVVPVPGSVRDFDVIIGIDRGSDKKTKVCRLGTGYRGRPTIVLKSGEHWGYLWEGSPLAETDSVFGH